MNHLGDITKIRGCVAPVVDVMIGGSPCQDLSIAGKRAGFSGERSVLFLEQIRVIKEMRASDKANGRAGEFIRPRYMVWENVPGAFSSNGGKDFGAVLAETVRVVESEAPAVPMPKAGWPNSGCLHGMVSGGGVLEYRLAHTRRTVLGSAPETAQDRAYRRFWRTHRTGNTICPRKPARGY